MFEGLLKHSVFDIANYETNYIRKYFHEIIEIWKFYKYLKVYNVSKKFSIINSFNFF